MVSASERRPLQATGVLALLGVVIGLIGVVVGGLSLMVTAFEQGGSTGTFYLEALRASRDGIDGKFDLMGAIQELNPQRSTRESDLYIVILDTSKSMAGEISTGAWLRYKTKVEAMDAKYPRSWHPRQSHRRCIAGGTAPSWFDVARLETCRLLNAIPVGSKAALFTFGDAPQMRYPRETGVGGDRYELVENPARGGSPVQEWTLAAVAIEQALEDLSDFVGLIQRLQKDYISEVGREHEVHFVIVSDFLHEDDFGRDYDMVRSDLGELIRQMSADQTYFHLAAVPSREGVSGTSVLPIFSEYLDADKLQVARLDTELIITPFDFMRKPRISSESLFFYRDPTQDDYGETRIIVGGESQLRTVAMSVMGSSEGRAEDRRYFLEDYWGLDLDEDTLVVGGSSILATVLEGQEEPGLVMRLNRGAKVPAGEYLRIALLGEYHASAAFSKSTYLVPVRYRESYVSPYSEVALGLWRLAGGLVVLAVLIVAVPVVIWACRHDWKGTYHRAIGLGRRSASLR